MQDLMKIWSSKSNEILILSFNSIHLQSTLTMSFQLDMLLSLCFWKATKNWEKKNEHNTWSTESNESLFLHLLFPSLYMLLLSFCFTILSSVWMMPFCVLDSQGSLPKQDGGLIIRVNKGKSNKREKTRTQSSRMQSEKEHHHLGLNERIQRRLPLKWSGQKKKGMSK